MDTGKHVTTLELDLVDGNSPLIGDLYDVQYADKSNRSIPRTISIKCPQDQRVLNMNTYTANYENGNNRIRLEIVPHG